MSREDEQIIIKPFSALSGSEVYELLKARFAVFYMEQDCHYMDMDDVDYQAIHVGLFRGGRVMAYARLYQDDEGWHAGRMLSVERGKGYGRLIMAYVLAEARRQGASMLSIHAQTHAVGFYEKFGFQSVGAIFQEADMPHIKMVINWQ